MADDTLGAESSALSETFDAMAERTRQLESGATGFARAMTQAFSRAVVDGRRFEDVLRSLTLRLSDLSLRAALKPLERGLAGSIDGVFANLFGGGAKLDGTDRGIMDAFSGVTAFADGGVIARPTYFPLGRGVGLAGEAGPEAILPLARGADGRLGVAANGGAPAANVTIHIATPDADSFRRSEVYVTGLIARAVSRGQRSL